MRPTRALPAADPCSVLRCGHGTAPRLDPAAEVRGRLRQQTEAEHLERLRAEPGRAEAEQRARLATFAAEVGRALNQSRTMPEALGRTAEAFVRHLDAAFARIWTLEEGAPVLALQASAGLYTHLDGGHSRVPVGHYKIGLIAQERRPHLTNDVMHDSRVSDREWARREGMVAFAGYPLLVEDHLVGVLAMFARHPLDSATLDELASVVDGVAQYIQRKRAEAELRQAYALLEGRVQERTRQLTTLLEVGRELASTHELHPLLASLLDHLEALVGPTGTGILIREGEELCYAHLRSVPDRWQEARHIRYSIERFRPAWERLSRDEPIIVGDVRDENPDARLFRALVAGETGLERIRSLMWVPLVVKGRIIGVLSMARSTPHAFTPREAELALAIARQAAVAIENARLHERDRAAAVLEERQRLSRELHDSVTQELYGVTLYAEAASRQLAAGNVETAREALREVRAAAGEALGEMRLLLLELRPALLEEGGLGAALRTRLSAVEARSGLATEVRLDDGLRLPAAVEQGMFRIAQEALNNVLKHARASRVVIALEADGGRARLTVADDGSGFETGESSGGLGLVGMRERAEALGATFGVESAPGAGTRITVEVPT
jgi:signal transduction histidine kinase